MMEQPHGEGLAELTEALAYIMEAEGVQAAIDLADSSSDSTGVGSAHLMGDATSFLFKTRDPLRMEPGLQYLEWVAQTSPSLSEAEGLSYDAKFDTRVEGFEWFAERCFNVAISHIKGVTEQPGHTPDWQFVETLQNVLARMEENGFRAAAQVALDEFAPDIITAGRNRPQPGELDKIDLSHVTFTLDGGLSNVALSLRRSNPELATQAESLIVSDREIESITQLKLDQDITEAFLGEDFKGVEGILSSTDDPYISVLWGAVSRELGSRGKTQAWGNQVIDMMIANVKPLFSSNVEAMFNGRSIGAVAGMLKRLDLLDAILAVSQDGITKQIILVEASFSAGLFNNVQIIDELLARVNCLDEETLSRTPGFENSIKDWFQTGLSQAESSQSD